MKFIGIVLLLFVFSFASFKYVEKTESNELEIQIATLTNQVELYKYFATIVPTKIKKSLFKAVNEKFSNLDKEAIIILSGVMKEEK